MDDNFKTCRDIHVGGIAPVNQNAGSISDLARQLCYGRASGAKLRDELNNNRVLMTTIAEQGLLRGCHRSRERSVVIPALRG